MNGRSGGRSADRPQGVRRPRPHIRSNAAGIDRLFTARVCLAHPQKTKNKQVFLLWQETLTLA